MTRFFIATENFKGDQIRLSGADCHHLSKVLRKKSGDLITVLNGKGEEFQARIVEIGPDSATADIIEKIARLSEPRVRINLVQSLPKADKFELVLQKNTELGVAQFSPILSERSTIKLDPKAIDGKMDRWRKIIKEAAEQSGRQVVPELNQVQSWPDFWQRPPAGLILIPWEGERERPLRTVLNDLGELPELVTILIGPEGGFSVDEVEQAEMAGAIPVTLGPRILRTETAGLVVASIILYQFGELG